MQMKMFLTRLGENSRMIVTGDPTPDRPAVEHQVGPGRGVAHPRRGAGRVTVRFNDADVVRHPLVAEIVRAYDRDAKMARGLAPSDLRRPCLTAG